MSLDSIMDRFSFLNAAHTAFFADLYDQYLVNPDSIEPSWRAFFQGFDFANEFPNGFSGEETSSEGAINNAQLTDKIQKEIRVLQLIEAYRTNGHLFADTNPVRDRRTHTPSLEIENYGLASSDLQTVFQTASLVAGNPTTLADLITLLKKLYCQSIAFEYKYIRDTKTQAWIEQKINAMANEVTADKKKIIIEKLNEAVSFENFLHTKYVGQKRFSLEGNEAVVPAFDILIEEAAELGVEQLVLGMAHRGRLNILANVFDKEPKKIFSEFDGKDYADEDHFDGDVKYHLGITTPKTTRKGKGININLVPNPSHLETVAAVVEGITRSKQDRFFPAQPNKVLPVIVHGDAAVSGQGIVYEIAQMVHLDGYKTQGTIHVVINNQVGFTTNYTDSRSATYCTDIAKLTSAPVIHVNADDAEAVVKAMLFALEYRMEFGSDVYIDVLGYRKYGHNEGDEPRFTQPVLYKSLSRHKNVRDLYGAKLVEQGVISTSYVKEIEEAYKAKLDENLTASREETLTVIEPFMQDEWVGFSKANQAKMLEKIDTAVAKDTLDGIAKVVTELPEGKKYISKIQKLINDRKAMYFEKNQLDWAMGEMLAYGSLLTEGYNVRISGQDVERGTFSHRHAVVKTEDTEEEVILLNDVPNKKGYFNAYNSLLSEYGVVGFDYGYAMASPKTLTIWEAQFGDFSNGAQIMIDQYISAAEDKWNNQNGLVILMPHGYENQGAEHSSARMERYLQLCSEQNMYVADCTTPANFFHLLRRQMLADFRKPLMVFTPKSLLRHPEAVSSIEEFATGSFQEVINDTHVNPADVKTLVFCTGKFYYDLKAEREAQGRNDVALIRIEQLFPLPVDQLKAIIASYPNATDYVWAQEEPRNMGAYGFMLMNFNEVKFRVASPKAYSAPASGSYTRSKKRHADAIAMVFDKTLV